MKDKTEAEERKRQKVNMNNRIEKTRERQTESHTHTCTYTLKESMSATMHIAPLSQSSVVNNYQLAFSFILYFMFNFAYIVLTLVGILKMIIVIIIIK